MRKREHIETAFRKTLFQADGANRDLLCLEVLLDIRDLVKKQNEIIRRNQAKKKVVK